jgi:hypothetical protein
MKKYLFTSLCSAIAAILFSGSTFKETTYFNIGIRQNGQEVPITDHRVIINKDVFSVLVKFQEAKGVLVNASFDPASYEEAHKGTEMRNIKGFTQTAMAEAHFNPDKEIMINDAAPCYWHYESKDAHRFSLVKKIKDDIVCDRVVEKFSIIKPGEHATVKVADAKSDKLYLVFISYETSKKGLKTETHRDFLEIILNQ